MTEWKLQTPVAFLVFNRPETTSRVFEEIRRVRPPILLVVADGPRADRTGDAEKCEAVRAIVDTVDWPCEVLKNYSEVNLGCKVRISSGIDWVFKQVEEAIILEDDCLPHSTFFRFCQEMLSYYRHDTRIAQIGGCNFQFGRLRYKESFYFSRHFHVWGWASWRRAWKEYDVNMALWPEIRGGNWLSGIYRSKRDLELWSRIFQSVYLNKVNTWDFQWTFACMVNNALSVIPNVNLVANIGFNSEATHTSHQNKFSNMKVEPIAFPLVVPRFILADNDADDYTMRNNFRTGNIIVSLVKRLISKYPKSWDGVLL